MTEDITLFNDLAEVVPTKETKLVDISELKLKFEYTPAEIKINNKEEFEQVMEAYRQRYDGYTVTAESFEDDAKVRASLNKLQRQVKNFANDQLADYNKPLEEAKTWINDQLKPIEEITENIDKGVKEFEELERQKRVDTIKETFGKAIEKAGEELNIKLFSEYFDDLSKKGCFMADNVRVNAATKKIIAGLVEEEVQKKADYDKALIKITEAAAKADFGPASYIKNFKDGANLADVLQAIADDKILADKVRAEERAKRELSKRIEEMTAIAESRGLKPNKYVKMLENGQSALEVHEILVTDANELAQKMQAEQEPSFESAENRQKTREFERESHSEGNRPTFQNDPTGAKTEPNKKVTKWQGDFVVTFPNSEIAKLFGGKGGLYEQHGVTVEKVGDWRKL